MPNYVVESDSNSENEGENQVLPEQDDDDLSSLLDNDSEVSDDFDYPETDNELRSNERQLHVDRNATQVDDIGQNLSCIEEILDNEYDIVIPKKVSPTDLTD